MKRGNSITVTRMAGSSQHDFAASVVPSIYYMTAGNTLEGHHLLKITVIGRI